MKRKSVITLLLIFSVLFSFCVPASAGSMSSFKRVNAYNGNFKDVSANAWYYSYVKTCYEYSFIFGTSPTTYSPSNSLTVAELITVASRLNCIYMNGSNTLDADNTKSSPWYKKYVDYAIANGIIADTDFTASDYAKPATRAMMVHIFSNIFPASEFPAYNSVNSIPDMKSGDKYYDEILTFYRAGILDGMDKKGTFAPNKTCTRAEAAKVFALVVIPSMRTGYTPPAALKSYSRKFTNTTIAFDAPTDYTESTLYGKAIVESKGTGVITSIDALRDSALADVRIDKLFTDAEIAEFYETDFAQSSDPITVTYCKAQLMSYGTITAFKVKISYTLYGSSYDCYAIMFITDSTLFEIMFDGPSGGDVLPRMVESFAVNGHNMYAK